MKCSLYNKINLFNLRRKCFSNYTRDKSTLLKKQTGGAYLKIELSEEVQTALDEKMPIVALESTIISHGMPYPRNIEVARNVEEIVRSNSATPATIAIIDGIIKVGLNEADLLRLARADMVTKASVRDLAFICAKNLTAATTVASTMRIADLVGISVFATGGIGGVHRGAETSWDVSADIAELGKTPVTVVCAGIKSILDIGKTLEMLETQGVPVVGFGTETFPAFFTNDSGFKSPLVTEKSADIAMMMANNDALCHRSGIVVAVPNPQPAATEKIQYAIEFALVSAQDEGITGPAVTPYVLKRVEKLTDGDSLEANVALILNNAKVAAQIAVDYAALSRLPSCVSTTAVKGSTMTDPIHPVEPSVDVGKTADPEVTVVVDEAAQPAQQADLGRLSGKSVVVVGGAVIDMIGEISTHVRMGSSNPGTIRTSFGGVARNVAASIARSSNRQESVIVKLATSLGDDLGGRGLLSHCQQAGIDIAAVKVLEGSSTAVYNAIHDGDTGDLCVGVADMTALKGMNVHYIKSLADSVSQATAVVADGNLGPEPFAVLANICRHYEVPLLFEPTSDHKCLLPFHASVFDKVSLVKPNISELVRMVSHCMQQGWITSSKAQIQNTLSMLVADRVDAGGDRKQLDALDLTDIRILTHALLQVMLASSSPKLSKSPLITGKHVIVSLGARGVLWGGPADHILQSSGKSSHRREEVEGLVHNEVNNIASWHIPAVPVEKPLVTNGAGDALLGGIVKGMLLQKDGALLPNLQCIQSGLLHAHEHMLGLSSRVF